MPSPVLPAGAIRAIVRTQTPRRVCNNILYYETDAPPIHQHDIHGIAAAIHNHIVTQWVAVLGSVCIFLGVEAYYHGAGDVLWQSPSGVEPSAGDYTASDSDALLPDEVALIIRKLTGRAGREDRGRLFISGIGETANSEGVVSTTMITNMIQLANRIPMNIDVTVPADGEYAGFSTQLHARHWNRKDNALRPIVAATTTQVVVSQARRRRPLQPVAATNSLPAGA